MAFNRRLWIDPRAESRYISLTQSDEADHEKRESNR